MSKPKRIQSVPNTPEGKIEALLREEYILPEEAEAIKRKDMSIEWTMYVSPPMLSNWNAKSHIPTGISVSLFPGRAAQVLTNRLLEIKDPYL